MRSYEMRFIHLCRWKEEHHTQWLNIIHSYVRSFVSSFPPISFHFNSYTAFFSLSAFASFISFSIHLYRSRNATDSHILSSNNSNTYISYTCEYSIVTAICSYYSLMLHGMSDESRRTYGDDGSKLKVRIFYFLRK